MGGPVVASQVGLTSQRPTVDSQSRKSCDDTDLVTNLVTQARKRRSPHRAGFVSACQHSDFLVAGARFELATFGL